MQTTTQSLESMDKIYYLQNGSEKTGPFSLDELRYRNINRTDLVWYYGISEWTEAQRLIALSSLFPQKMPPLPTKNLSDPGNYLRNSYMPQYHITYLENNTVVLEDGIEIITYRFANFGERLGARLLDILIISIPSLCLPVVATWLYWALQQSSDEQQTVGQKTLNIKLLSTDGKKIKFGKSTGRYFANLLNSLTLGIGYLMFFFNDKNQCLHDLISETIVVKEISRTLK